MLKRKVLEIPKVWFTFTKANSDGKIMRFRWEKLTDQRYEDYINYIMKFYINKEITHVAAGIYKNPKAMEDFKKVLTPLILENPAYQTDICCLEDDSNKIVAFSSVILYRKGETYEVFPSQGKTTELKKLYDISYELSNLLPLSNIWGKYNIDKYVEDFGCGVHPDFTGYGITYTIGTLRNLQCENIAVPLTGAWVTALATQRTTKRDGWETIYKVSYEQLGKKLGVTFKNAPPSLKYKIRHYH